MKERKPMDRRRFLKNSAGVSAGLLAAPAGVTRPASTQAATPAAASQGAPGAPAFVDSYTTNVTGNLTPETNAAVRILSGMQQIWKTGATWDSGVPLQPHMLRDNMRYSAAITRDRTEAQAKEAFIYDRQHQSYAAIGGLGPLAGLYKAGAKAVTSITTAPDGTPPTTVNDAVPPGAPAGSDIGAGSTTSDLGLVVTLVSTLRGNYASGNPGKYAYQYPRPWRMNDDSQVVDTGAKDALGYPVYKSDVIVAPQLLRQRGTSPADDGGFPSGHTNAFWLASLALAYAIPERFQELVASAAALSHTRILAGMHSAADVIGGRILGTALAAAALYDPNNAALKAAARRQAAAWFQAQTGTTADTLYAYAHSAGTDTDPYADREANRAALTPRLTYVFSRRGDHKVPMTVPKGAEVLLETRLPYLDAAQRREVLRTTALPSGYILLDGPEQWGRLDLFTAADGYGAFDSDVRVAMNAADGGFSAADTWRNDIDGDGGLVKQGTGALTLTGTNGYRGGTTVAEGTLVAASPHALGRGDVTVGGGTLSLAADGAEVYDDYLQSSGATLEVVLGDGRAPALTVRRTAALEPRSVLSIRLADGHRQGDRLIPVLGARRLRGAFGTITVQAEGCTAVPVYTATGLSVWLTTR